MSEKKLKFFNMRNNEEIGDYSADLKNFLAAHLLEPDESDEDFFIEYQSLKVLESKARTEEEQEFVKAIREVLEKEVGQSGIDIYHKDGEA